MSRYVNKPSYLLNVARSYKTNLRIIHRAKRVILGVIVVSIFYQFCTFYWYLPITSK